MLWSQSTNNMEGLGMTAVSESCTKDNRYECKLTYNADLTADELSEILRWLDRVTEEVAFALGRAIPDYDWDTNPEGRPDPFALIGAEPVPSTTRIAKT
jgi:hypothetical protein